ncbi:MAG: ECF transporter S component [Bacillota bacterium]|jgi:ABC-type thiamin/hydroxymethylpyrimidine transport system permease subunit|nr:ECF transporter S component [Bacillota bacterium]HHU29202.1 ECF transporter S component [Bacillota bacterium]
MLRRLLSRFSTFDLILLALMACLGIATKPVIVPLTHIITGPLFIPGGVIAGGFYMMWLVMGAGLVAKPGAGTLTAAVQAVMVTALGIYGTHGILSLATYLLPGVAVDLVMLLWRYRSNSITCCFAAGIAANASGTVLVNFVFFRLPWIPLILSVASAALSGGLGGIIAYGVIRLRSRIGRRG